MNYLLYVDPSGGTFILQTIIAIGVVIVGGIGFYWRRSVRLLKSKKEKNESKNNFVQDEDKVYDVYADDLNENVENTTETTEK